MWKVLRMTSSYWGRQMPSWDDDSARRVVLLIEAHPWLNDFLAEALADEGYAVAQARDGNRALMLARQQAPAAIVLDPRALDVSVEQVLGQLSANRATRSIPVVLLRADDEAEPPDLQRLLSQLAAVLGPTLRSGGRKDRPAAAQGPVGQAATTGTAADAEG